MRKRQLSKIVGYLSGVAATAVLPGAVQAQSSADAGNVVITDEIIVTALRREERLQEVPAALSVLDGTALQAKGAQDYRDYVTSVPGVSYAEGGLRGMRVTIRGVSDGVGATDPLTGIYIDETPVTESFQATLDPSVYDVERVEILKGPQGTLYGSGSMGGTVRVITKKPKLNRWEGALEGTVSDVAHGGANGRVDGVVNVPVVDDRVALRVSGGYRKDAGWIDNVRRGEKNVNTVEKTNARAQLLLQPGDDTTVVLGFLYQKEDLGNPFYDDLGLPDYQTARIYRDSADSDAKLYSATIQHDFDWMSLLSATNYMTKHTVNRGDSTVSLRPLVAALAGVALGDDEGVGVESGNKLNLFTQEVRLSSVGQNRLDWVVGAFYSNVVTDATTVFDFSQAPSTTGVTTGAAFYDSAQEYRTRQIAAFGELTLNVTDALSLTAGLRAFDVDQRNTLADSGILNGGTTVKQQKASSASSTKKFLAKYQATPDTMIYAQAVQGYRNGGPTGGFPHSACAADLAAIGYSSVPTQYSPDKLWNYEIGSKNTLLDGRMTLNGSAFYIDWSDIQTAIGLSCGFSLTTNSGQATSKGLELDVSFKPIPGLTLAAAGAYIDAKIKEAAVGGAARDGDPLPLTAKWSWNISAMYEHDLTGDLTGFVRAEVNHVGKRWNTFRSVTARARRLDDYTTLGVRVGVSGESWSAALFASNLTDKRYVTYTPGTNYEVVGTPRVIGLNARINY